MACSRVKFTITSHVRLVLPSWLFTSGFATITLCATLLLPLLATGLAHLLHLELIIMQSPPVPCYLP